MNTCVKRICSLLLTAVLLLSIVAVGVPLQASAAPVFDTVGGWNETMYATIKGIADADVKSVSYSGPMNGSLTGEDFEYLVRSTTGGVRIDILGLKAGTYSLSVETTSGTVTASNVVVPAQDRSGFAHDNYTQGVGAYNDDGTLKDNAIVLYVTNSNKNSLTLTAPDGTSVAGIGHILNSAGQDVGGGLTSDKGAANNNAGILAKLAAADIPLVVRIIGTVSTPDGVTAENSKDYGGITGDNGSMVRMKNCKDITIEGVGASGTVDGWGFSFIAASGDSAKGWGRNFEVRNITFENVPEDCVGLEGQQTGDELTDPIERCWIHHNTFVGPSLGGGGDKANGDGACDWKRGLYYTNSYNFYNVYRKTNLIGSNDDCLQYYATFHHNYWYDCSQRQPLCRQAEVHLYNNIWYSAGDYCISPRASSYILVEYSFFDSNSDLVDSSGSIDSIGCEFSNNEQEPTSFNQITDKSQLSSNRLDGTYVTSGDYIMQTDIEEMKAVVYAQTGSQRASGDSSLDPDAPEDESASLYAHSFTEYGLESDFYSFSGTLATNKGSTSYKGKSLTQCLVFDSTDDYIKFTAPVDGELVMVFGGSTSDKNNSIYVNGTTCKVDTNNQLIMDISAGECTITRGDVVHIWYIGYVPSEEIEIEPSDPSEPTTHTHSYTSSVTTAATCTTAGVRTYTCSCGASYTESIAALGHNYSGGVCTRCGAADPNYEAPVDPSEPDPTEPTTPPVSSGEYVHNFTDDGFTSSFYTFAGNQITNGKHGTYTYDFGSGTETLNYALKFDSGGSAVFIPPADGTVTIAVAAQSAGRTVVITDGSSNIGTVSIDTANQLFVLTVDVSANVSYTVKRSSGEAGLYYIAYAPASSGGDVHTHSYSKVVTAPTCTAQGYTTYTCSCGDSYVADYVAATGHSYNSAVTTAATCESAGVRTYTCANCGDSYTESIPATGHSYSAVVTAPTCTAGGHTTYICSKCGNSYQGAFTSALGHSYKDGYCTVCGAEDPNYVALFDLYGSNVNLGNDLTMNFYVSVNNINGEAYYIEIVKEYDDGSTVTTTVPYAEWESYYGVMWKVSLKGMAAKEMADKIYVTVYTTAGVQVSNTWTDSIRDYCIRQLNNASQSGAYTLLADMLNYGAAAQTQFGYNTDDLANSTMTAAQKAYATQSFNLSDYENNQVKGTNYIGSSLSLETNIQLTIYFNKLSSSNGLRAVVSYTDHLGEAKSYEVAEADFTTLAGIYYGIVVDTLVAADVCQVVSVALYDGSTLVGYASDSMESYAVRQSGDMNIALMKFTLSAYEFLH